MPKDNIERAIKRGTGELEGMMFEEITYEGIGPGGVAILVDVLTDNRNRTSGEVRKIFERGGGKMGSPGCRGVSVRAQGAASPSRPRATTKIRSWASSLDAGADDMQRQGDDTSKSPAIRRRFTRCRKRCSEQHPTHQQSEITQLAKVPVDVDAETGRKVMRLLEALDDHDDVQHVCFNANIPDEVLAEG